MSPVFIEDLERVTASADAIRFHRKKIFSGSDLLDDPVSFRSDDLHIYMA
jgi:hypothetical protein